MAAISVKFSAHGEPRCGIGQGDVAEHATGSPGEAFWAGEQTTGTRSSLWTEDGHRVSENLAGRAFPPTGNGVVHVDFSSRGPDATKGEEAA